MRFDGLIGARIVGTLDRPGRVLSVRQDGRLVVEFDGAPGWPTVVAAADVRAA